MLTARNNVAKKAKKELMFEAKIADYMSKPLPEKANMSFMGKPERLNRELAIAIIRKTDCPCYYRYGYAYRGAEKKLITREKAETLIHDNNGYLDFRYDGDEIIVNEFSSNDMW